MLDCYLDLELLFRIVGVVRRGTVARLIYDLIVIAIGSSDVVDRIVSVYEVAHRGDH
jgi:hypothetical protein